MKKPILIILAAALAFTGCKKDSGNKPSGPSSDSYLPVTTGTSWTYKNVSNAGIEKEVIQVTGATTIINGKTYYNVTSTSDKTGVSNGFFYADNHRYALRSMNATVGFTIEMALGDDSQSVGFSWTTSPTDNGTVNGLPAQTINTIKEKGISKTVNDKAFTNVIHTQADLQYDFGGGFESVAVYDFYLAKGVGVIETDTRLYDTTVSTSTITGYTIK